MSTKKQDALVTIKEAATALSVHPDTIRRWITERRIPHVRLPGGTHRLKQATVEKIREERAANSQPEQIENDSPDQDPLLTPTQAAAMLEVSTQTVRNWISDDLIPNIRLPGGFYRIRKSRITSIKKEVLANKTAAKFPK
jgi:excisionase family DNA binding protein